MKKSGVIIIAGAGFVGSWLSIFLSRRGYYVRHYEKRIDMRKKKLSAGRSINLALSGHGLLAWIKWGLQKK